MAINFLDGISIDGLSTQGSEGTALVINGSNVVGTRELGSNAFNSTTIPTNNNQLTNGEGYTTNTGTVTSANGSNNRVATFSSATALNGESALTFDGTTLETTGTVQAVTVRATGGTDGGFALRQWTNSANYASLATNGMTGSEYCMLSDGQTTFIGAGTGGSLKLRGPANDSSPQITINGSSVTIDDGSTVGSGAVRAKYKSSDNSSGLTTTVGVRNSNNSASLTLTIKDGIITGVSSDRRLKTNITLIGTSESGINIYTFEYKYKFGMEGIGLFQGVMSDEIPDDAVTVDRHGFDVVDYSLIDVEFKRVSIWS